MKTGIVAAWVGIVLALGGLSSAGPRPLAAGDDADVADVPSHDCQVAGNAKQRYFLIGGGDKAKAPAEGYALLLVLPGGDGGADFNPFIRRIYQNGVPEGFVVAQLVAVPSDRPNQIVWPTARAKDPKQDFSTESFVAAVIKDVKTKLPANDKRVYALGWSSGGPAVYAAALAKDSPLAGGYVAMSVFRANELPLANARGRRFFLLQSPQDQVTRFFFAKTAKSQLEKNGAAVELREYDGGHGWRGDVFGNIRAGIEWLGAKKE